MRNNWSDQVIARVLSSYATSLVDLAELLRSGGRWLRQADNVLVIAGKLEMIAREVRSGRVS